jgi:hypothetical protein
MIIISFVLEKKQYFIDYKLIKVLPYFLIAVSMVIFAQYINYESMVLEFALNTVFVLGFVMYAQYKDRLLSVFFRKE